MIRRFAAARTFRRLTHPLRLRLIDWRMKKSVAELARLREFKIDLAELERIEYQEQTSLGIRRMAIEREL